MSLHSLKSQFAYKAWANTDLYGFIATQETGPHIHTAIRTLNHIYVVDKIFQAHLRGTAHPYSFANTDDTPTIAELSWNAQECDAWYQEYLTTLSVAELDEVLQFTFTDGDQGRMSREEILNHVLQHGAYHRGNVGQIFKSLNIAPPRDLYTKFLHTSEPARRAV